MHYLVILFILYSFDSHSNILLEQRSPKGIGYPGEVETFALLDAFNLYSSNDVKGDTDKLVTATAGLEYTHSWERYSFSFSSSTIFITPIFKTKFNEDELETPIGGLADIKQFALSQSFFIPIGSFGLRIQLSAVNHDAKDHGSKELQRNFHTAIGSSFDLEDFESVENSQNFLAHQGELLLPSFPFLFGTWSFGVGASYKENFFFKETSYDSSLVIKYSKNFKIYARYMHINQHGSDFFKGIMKQTRFQLFVGLAIGDVWFPSFIHSSVYLDGDEYAQTYLSFLNLSF